MSMRMPTTSHRRTSTPWIPFGRRHARFDRQPLTDMAGHRLAGRQASHGRFESPSSPSVMTMLRTFSALMMRRTPGTIVLRLPFLANGAGREIANRPAARATQQTFDLDFWPNWKASMIFEQGRFTDNSKLTLEIRPHLLLADNVPPAQVAKMPAFTLTYAQGKASPTFNSFDTFLAGSNSPSDLHFSMLRAMESHHLASEHQTNKQPHPTLIEDRRLILKPGQWYAEKQVKKYSSGTAPKGAQPTRHPMDIRGWPPVR